MTTDRDAEPVLLVEDEEAVRALLSAVLARAGYRVLAAASAVEGLELLAAEPAVRLLVADLTLPAMDGLELVRRARERQPRLRALIVSGYPVDHLRLARAAFLQKPFLPHVLVEEVRALLSAPDEG